MSPSPSRLVSTIYGPVQGLRLVDEGERSVDAFLGVPFAKPPVGELRFKKPQPVDTWTDILHAVRLPRRAMQDEMAFGNGQEPCAKSEDSLYLNVFTPTWIPPEGGFPVMFFIHGGGFVAGDSSTCGDESICRLLCAKDVIVVTIQYRLGYLGFFSTGDSACPGNLGLWDQTEALKWTRDNIAAFAGNPNNITVFGQSAGGASVDLLMLSPHSNGLFDKAAPMAGSALCCWAFNEEAVENCREHVERLGVNAKDSEEMLRELRLLPATQLSAPLACDTATGEFAFDTTPVIDGDFLPESVSELRKKAPHKPLLSGITKLESNMFVAEANPTVDGVRASITRLLPAGLPGKEKAVARLLELYKVDDSKESTLLRAHAEAASDEQFNLGMFRMMKESLAAGWTAPVYSYCFDYFNPKAFGAMAVAIPFQEAGHCTELNYLLGRGPLSTHELEGEELAVADLFTTIFTNFAKYGNPNGPNDEPSELPELWPQATLATVETHFVISKEPRVEKQLFNGRLTAYAELLETGN